MDREGLFCKIQMGRRILKTGFAVWLCLLLCHVFNLSPFFAIIAAVICMKVTTQDSIDVGVNRVLGTVIGGFIGMVTLYGLTALAIAQQGYIYDLIAVAVLMVMIKALSLVYRTGAVIITAVVYLSILYMDIGDVSIFIYSATRVLETLLGVVVAILINRLIPNRHLEET